MAIHELKTDVDAFCAVKDGFQHAEFRKDDRGFRVGDTLVLKAHVRGEGQFAGYTGAELRVRVTHIVRDAYGVPPGFCMMSFAREATGAHQCEEECCLPK